MKIFIDSANQREILHWLREGVIDGVTTNPSIMLKDGIHDIEDGTRQMASRLGERSLSVEVTSNDCSEMIRQGREFSSLPFLPDSAWASPRLNYFELMRTLSK